MSETKVQGEAPKNQPIERTCAECDKIGTGFFRCGRCKITFYCSKTCQRHNWEKHKVDCVPPEQRPPPVDEKLVVDYVECETFQDCRDYLIKHPEIIRKDVADEMFERGFFTLKSHPPEFGTRFIRNSQILTYLLDLRKISGGQQDISLFFARMLDETNQEYRRSFVKEYTDCVNRILKRWKEKEAEEKQQKVSSPTKD